MIFCNNKEFALLPSRNLKPNHGINLNIYSSNSHGRSEEEVTLETSPSKVAELQSGKYININNDAFG